MVDKSRYGFSVGDLVITKAKTSYTEYVTERYCEGTPDEFTQGRWKEFPVPVGTVMRLVAIAPKVRYTSKYKIKEYPDQFDGKEYFYNAVPLDPKVSDGQRIRDHFVTIRKCTEKEIKNYA